MANEKIPWDDLEATSVPEVEAGNIENRTLNDEKTYTTSDSRILDFIENGIEVAQPEETKPDDMQLYSGAPSKNWETHSYYSDISDSGKLSLETEGRVENYDPAGEPDGSTILGEGNLTREKFDGDNSVKKPTDWVTAGREPEWEYKYWEFKESYAFDSAKAAGEYLNDQPEWHTIDLGKITVEGYEPEENYNDCDEFIHDLKFYYINKYFDIPNGKEFSDTVIGFYFETEDAAKEEFDYSNVAIVCKKGIHIFQKNVEGKYEDQFLRGGHTNYDSEIIKFVTDKNNFETPLDPTSEFWIKNVTKEVDLSQQDGQGLGTTHTPHTLGIKSGTEENVFQNAATFRFHDSRVEALAKQTYEQVDELLYNDSILERTIYDENKRAVVREAEIDTRLSKEIARAQYEEKRIEARATEFIETWDWKNDECIYTYDELEAFMEAGKVLTYQGHILFPGNLSYLFYFDDTAENDGAQYEVGAVIQKAVLYTNRLNKGKKLLQREESEDRAVSGIKLEKLLTEIKPQLEPLHPDPQNRNSLWVSGLRVPSKALSAFFQYFIGEITLYGQPIKYQGGSPYINPTTKEQGTFIDVFQFSDRFPNQAIDLNNQIKIIRYEIADNDIYWNSSTTIQINRLIKGDLDAAIVEKGDMASEFYPSLQTAKEYVKKWFFTQPPQIYFINENVVENDMPVTQKVLDAGYPVNGSSIYFIHKKHFSDWDEIAADTPNADKQDRYKHFYFRRDEVSTDGAHILEEGAKTQGTWELVSDFDLIGSFLTSNDYYDPDTKKGSIPKIDLMRWEICDLPYPTRDRGSKSPLQLYKLFNDGCDLMVRGERVIAIKTSDASTNWNSAVIYTNKITDSYADIHMKYIYTKDTITDAYVIAGAYEADDDKFDINSKDFSAEEYYRFYLNGLPLYIDGNKVLDISKDGKVYICSAISQKAVEIIEDVEEGEEITGDLVSHTRTEHYNYIIEQKEDEQFLSYELISTYGYDSPYGGKGNQEIILTVSLEDRLTSLLKELDKKLVDVTELEPNPGLITYCVNGEAIVPKVYSNTDTEENIQETAALNDIDNLIEEA